MITNKSTTHRNNHSRLRMEKGNRLRWALSFGIISLAVWILANGCDRSGMEESTVILNRYKDSIELQNGRVRLLLVLVSSSVTQTYFAEVNGHWKEVASSYPRSEKPGDNILPLYDKGPGFADDYRLMANEGFDSVSVLQENKDVIRLLLSGRIKGNTIEQTVELRPDQDYFHIEIKAELKKEAKLEYLLSSFTFGLPGEPDYTFVPSQKRADDDLIGDRKFFAPAAIVEKDGFLVALVPDLYLINKNIVYAKGARPQKHPRIFSVPIDTNRISLPTGLNLDLKSGVSKFPLISYGLIDYWVEQHVYWRHENGNGKQIREVSDNRLLYGFDLFLDSEVEKNRGYRRISSFLWEKYGKVYFQRPKPQAMPFSNYAEVCYPATFAYQGYDVLNGAAMGELAPRRIDISISHRKGRPELETWQQWDENGVAKGGLRLSAPQWYQFIYNTSWWNNVCDATGIYYWGKKLKDSTLIDKARRIVNFTLTAPQNGGIFPSLYNVDNKTWIGSLWNPPSGNYDPHKEARYFDWDHGIYQTSSASVTAGYLLQYRKTCENNPGIIPFVQRYGDFLIQNMQSNGCVPGWFSNELIPLPSLKWNADGGSHIWVLSELYKATNEIKYLEAAKKMAHFMIKEVMPRQKWFDFETFYSCAVKPETFFDERTGQYPANNMSLSWALEGFTSLYEVTKDSAHLSAAEACADYSIFYQAVWAPHYIITAYPYGGFSSQNSDAEWLDQRSHRFANSLVRIGLLSNRQDLIERGVAAMRSSLTLVNHPLHIQNEIYKYPNYPIGLGPENIDHEGFSQMPLRSGPSWCEVGGLTGAAHVLNHLGGAYIDFDKNIAVGVDGVSVVDHSVIDQEIRITMKSLLAGLSVPFNRPYPLELRLVGLEAQNYTLALNNGPKLKFTEKELEKLPVTVYPDGRILIDQ